MFATRATAAPGRRDAVCTENVASNEDRHDSATATATAGAT